MKPVVVSWLIAIAFAAGAQAQPAQSPYPSKLVRLVTGSAAGGGSDITARQIGPKLAESCGQQVLVIHPSVPAKTVKELIAVAKAAPK